MPPIKDRLKGPANFAAAENPNPQPPMPNVSGVVGVNPFIRCPLPPLNVGPDTLRQFDESGPVPTRRVIPLPIQTVAGGGTVKEVVTASGSSSGGGGGVIPPTLTPASIQVTVPALPAGGHFQTNATLAKAFQLLSLLSNQPVEVRIYGSSLAQAIDVSRLSSSPTPYQAAQGIITDIIFDTFPFTWTWQNRVGANGDPTVSSTAYITVVNPSAIGVPPSTLTITYLPLEA